jgi:hypothetical protein
MNFCTLPVTVIGRASTNLTLAGNLEMRDLLTAKAANILLGRGTAILQSDPGAQLLAVLLVRHAEYLGIFDWGDA